MAVIFTTDGSCCCGLTGTGTGTVTQTPCCPSPIPETLYFRVVEGLPGTGTGTGTAAPCSCLEGLTGTLHWDSSQAAWTTRHPDWPDVVVSYLEYIPVLACGGTEESPYVFSIYMQCVVGGGSPDGWRIFIQCKSSPPATCTLVPPADQQLLGDPRFHPWTCDPFSVTAYGTFPPGGACCCPGAEITVLIAETPP